MSKLGEIHMIIFVILGAMLMAKCKATEFEPCGGKPADIFFAIDSSGSISKDNFRKEIRFTKDVARMFDIGPSGTHVGLLSFSKTVSPQFGIDDNLNKDEILDEVDELAYEGRGTNTAEALSYIREKGLSSRKTRPGIPHIAIILTDGMSQTPRYTEGNATLVHQAGITVFVIGIGREVDRTELSWIASKPTEDFMFMIDDFDALSGIRTELAIKACEVLPMTPEPDIQSHESVVEEELLSIGKCTPRVPVDIVYAVDTAAIGASNTKFVISFLGNVTDHLNLESGSTTISTVTSGCSAGGLDEDASTSAGDFKQKFSSFQSPRFHDLMRNMRLKAADGAMSSRHVGIIFLGDQLERGEYNRARLEMRRAKFRGTIIMSIGVGDRVKEEQVKGLSTNAIYFQVSTYEQLGSLEDTLAFQLCTIAKKE